MKRTFAIVLTLAFALPGSMGCGGAQSPPNKTCRNPDLETCTTPGDPTSQPDAGT